MHGTRHDTNHQFDGLDFGPVVAGVKGQVAAWSLLLDAVKE
jgi:hypothetical protein